MGLVNFVLVTRRPFPCPRRYSCGTYDLSGHGLPLFPFLLPLPSLTAAFVSRFLRGH